MCLAAALAGVLSPYDPTIANPAATFQPPFSAHLLGTDDLGRDFFSRLLYGSRYTLIVGVLTALVAVSLGSIAGSTAGLYGGVVDGVITRLIDIIYSIPVIPFVMLIGAFVEMTPLRLVLTISLFQWLPVARLARGEVLSLRERDFVLAARCLGASGKRLVFRHLLPNTVAPVAVAATLVVANAILIESAVSFLGFGIQPPTPTWGNLLTRAQSDVHTAPWLAILPGILLSLCVISVMFVGDALRDAFDPRLTD